MMAPGPCQQGSGLVTGGFSASPNSLPADDGAPPLPTRQWAGDRRLSRRR